MQRIGDKIAKNIYTKQAIKKVQRDDTEKKTHQGTTEVPGYANDRQRKPNDPSKPVRMDTGDTETDN